MIVGDVDVDVCGAVLVFGLVVTGVAARSVSVVVVDADAAAGTVCTTGTGRAESLGLTG